MTCAGMGAAPVAMMRTRPPRRWAVLENTKESHMLLR
jgi:hypothetical protein